MDEGIVSGNNLPRAKSGKATKARNQVHLAPFTADDDRCRSGMRSKCTAQIIVDEEMAVRICRFRLTPAGAFVTRDTIPPKCIREIWSHPHLAECTDTHRPYLSEHLWECHYRRPPVDPDVFGWICRTETCMDFSGGPDFINPPLKFLQ